MSVARRKVHRVAPRYRMSIGDNGRIRYALPKQNRINSSMIFDISETGISFITTRKQAPRIGEIIRMDFQPVGSGQIACLGKVMRIEEPTSSSLWAKQPEAVKVGIAFYDLPQHYRQVLTESVRSAFRDNKRADRFSTIEVGESPVSQWVANYGLFLILSGIFLTLFIFGYRFLTENVSSNHTSNSSPWAKSFFDRNLDK